MAKGSFICRICRDALEATGWNRTVDKFKCPKHKDICSECVDKPLFGGYKCSKCGSKVQRYEFSKSYGKWMKA